MGFTYTVRKLTPEEIRERQAVIDSDVKLFEALEAKCKELKLDYTSRHNKEGYPEATVSLPKGSSFREVFVTRRENVVMIRDLPIDDYRTLDEFECLWMPGKGTVEVRVRPCVPRAYEQMKTLLLGDSEDPSSLCGAPFEFGDCQFGTGIQAVFNEPSDAYRALLPHHSDANVTFFGILDQQHDAVVEMIRALSNSLFFEVYSKYGIALRAGGYREALPSVSFDLFASVTTSTTPIRYRYDDVPSRLFWHAHRIIDTLPSFSFLAFYQVAEYYFLRYWKLETRGRVRNLLKNPSFVPDSDDDMSRLIDVISNDKQRGNELSFFASVVRHCVGDTELERFLNLDVDRAKHNRSNKSLGLPLVNPKDHKADLCTAVAGRLYDLRCKLVHTKEYSLAESKHDIYLGSPLISDIGREIELMEFVSRHVLIAASIHL